MDRKTKGALGESMAAAQYRADGYEVLDHNYRTRQGEIDLVVSQRETLVFVEVKTRSPGGIGTPREAVTTQKQKRLALAALDYIAQKNVGDMRMRFDVVEVLLQQGGAPQLHRIENAFEYQPGW